MLTFVIPVRHPHNSPDWKLEMAYLRQTACSIAMQTSAMWQAVVVANAEASLPPLPRGVEVVRVDCPPNPLYVRGNREKEPFYEAVRLDKGRRILAGMLHVERRGYFMVVDDDDLVSNRLAEFAATNDGANGWYFHDGYLWEDGSRFLYRYSRFSRLCGTSHVIRADLYRLPIDGHEVSDSYVKRTLGSHIFIRDDLERAGTPLAPLPFPGAIYRIGHPIAHSRSSGLATTVFMKKKVLTDARTFLANVWRLRRLTKPIRDEFFHGSPRIVTPSPVVDV